MIWVTGLAKSLRRQCSVQHQSSSHNLAQPAQQTKVMAHVLSLRKLLSVKPRLLSRKPAQQEQRTSGMVHVKSQLKPSSVQRQLWFSKPVQLEQSILEMVRAKLRLRSFKPHQSTHQRPRLLRLQTAHQEAISLKDLASSHNMRAGILFRILS